MAEPRIPVGELVRRRVERMAPGGREAVSVLVGLWPLTTIMAVAFALLWAAGVSGSP